MLAVECSRSHTRMKWPARAARAVALLSLLSLLSLFTVFSMFSAACSNNTIPTASAPTTPTTVAGPATETLSGSMARNGTAIRTFTASKSGTVSVTLASAGPPSTIVLGLGIGIKGATGTDCNFSQTVNTSAGSAPQLNVSVDAGTYCAGVYDIGNIGPNGITVSVTVNHP
jgi:hypothetical protein